MRILHVLHSQGYGGAENHALVLMLGQLAAGHEVMYAGRRACWLAQACEAHGIPVLPLRMAGLFDIVSHLTLRIQSRRWGADIIHGHLVRGAQYAGLAAASHGTPVAVCTAHATTAVKHMDRCAHIIAVSQAVERNLLAHHHSASKVSVVYNGMPDVPHPDRAALRQELNIPDHVHAVVNVGRFVHDKGQDVLIEAMRHCPTDMHLYLIGDPDTPYGQQVTQQAHDLPRVHFLGYRNDVQRLLPAFDAYALSSRREALGLSIVEASAACMPIVATAVGGVPEVVLNEQTGLLVPVNQADALAQALIRLRNEPLFAQHLAHQARERYLTHFTVNGMVQATLDVYRHCLAQA